MNLNMHNIQTVPAHMCVCMCVYMYTKMHTSALNLINKNELLPLERHEHSGLFM